MLFAEYTILTKILYVCFLLFIFSGNLATATFDGLSQATTYILTIKHITCILIKW